MVIKGFQEFSLLDYQDRIACIVFVPGCNFRCGYCHNRDLVQNSSQLPKIRESAIFAFLQKRKGQLDGVVITGGEPTLQKDLEEFVGKIRKAGFLVKLDTNGSRPEILTRLIKKGLLDCVAMDLKGPLDLSYHQIAERKVKVENLQKSIKLLVGSGVGVEFRTTVVPTLHSEKALILIAEQLSKEIKRTKAPRVVSWYLQQFRPQNCLNREFEKIKPYDQEELERFTKKLRKIFPKTFLRV